MVENGTKTPVQCGLALLDIYREIDIPVHDIIQRFVETKWKRDTLENVCRVETKCWPQKIVFPN